MAEGKYTLTKIAAGDYRLDVHGDPTIWRVVKYEGLGSGSRGMYGYQLWGVEKWLGRVGQAPDSTDPSQWAFQPGEYDTRSVAVDAVLKERAGRMTNYGPKHVIEDEYGQDVQVDIEMGGEITVCLCLTTEVLTPPPAPLPKRRDRTLSVLTPEQARNLAKQLEAAANDAQPLEPPKREEAAQTAAPDRSSR